LNGGMKNLLSEGSPTLLPADPAAEAALAEAIAVETGGVEVGVDDAQPARDATAAAEADAALKSVAARFPAYSAAWARLAHRALGAGDPVTAYAFARTGYHRGLDQLRRSGWPGHGPVPWSHEPNRGFLRSLHALGKAADGIGEAEEAARCAQFLRDCDADATAYL
jgi:hypothetical protein